MEVRDRLPPGEAFLNDVFDRERRRPGGVDLHLGVVVIHVLEDEAQVGIALELVEKNEEGTRFFLLIAFELQGVEEALVGGDPLVVSEDVNVEEEPAKFGVERFEKNRLPDLTRAEEDGDPLRVLLGKKSFEAATNLHVTIMGYCP